MNMLRQLGLAGTAAALALSAFSLVGPPSADAVIHEIVAAYCSGGGVGVIGEDGDLEPPGLSDPTKQQSFARPVLASGAVDFPFITDKPNTKFAEGTSVLAPLDGSNATHPSADHCVKNGLP
jgi:hypothetical protein